MDRKVETQAYAQWVEMQVFSENMDIEIKNASLSYGKFHSPGNKDNELSEAEINSIVIKSGTSYKIASCGRENASSGTEGKFDIYSNNKWLATYKWDCPWSGANSHSLSVLNDKNYQIDMEGGNIHDGALGNIRIVCIKVG
ncbi:aegerolysin family protein [Klebsiella quasipneumoniae]|uniref:aegerolysin family protein n=1 Tax=Klebsiella pneumoniae TaxID=573 RepID=UPI0036D5A8F0